MNPVEKPKLRALQAVPFMSDGEQVVCLRDPTGLSRKTVVLTPRSFFLAALCDGEHTASDMQTEYVRRFGDLILSDKVAELIRQLDDALLLEGERFENYRRTVAQEFARTPVRRAVSVGSAYPAQPQALRQMLNEFFTAKDGPGPVDPAKRGRSVVAAAAPHIDLRRGGVAYAHAWKALAEGCAADTFVVLGIAHNPAKSLFVPTDKSFDTPLGRVECDRDFARDLIHRADLKRDDELLHRGEHSIEFQALWLRHVFGASRPARIVPILCGPILEAVGDKPDPMQVGEIRDFVGALREILNEQGDSAAVLASVDLSHVGQKFGDRAGLSSGLLGWVETEDRALLKHAEDVNAPAFFDHNRRDKDARHVCGFSALYVLLASITASRGRLLHYDQAPEEETQSVVSFAALAFDS